MIYDFPRLFQDFGIDFTGPNSRGRFELECPMPDCHSSSGKFMGSIHKDSYDTYVCYKCSYHPLGEVIKYLTGQNWDDIKYNYKLEKNVRDLLLRQNKPEVIHANSVKLPKGDVKDGLNERAFKYLYDRKFDPYSLIEKYKIYSTGVLGDYKFRIIIPIYFDRKLISYQGRDYTGLSPLRYKSCKQEEEVMHYKDIVYGIDTVPGDHCFVVEGITDKWRIGDYAVAMFGVGYTSKQVLLLAHRFKKFTIIFDPKAERQAEKLGNELCGLGLTGNIIYLKGDEDIGAQNQMETDRFIRKILKNS